MEDPTEDTLKPNIARILPIISLCLSICALMVGWSHWGLVEERAWQLASDPAQTLDWMSKTYGMLRTMLIMGGLVTVVSILQLIKPRIKKNLPNYLSHAGNIVFIVSGGYLLYYFFQHWSTYL